MASALTSVLTTDMALARVGRYAKKEEEELVHEIEQGRLESDVEAELSKAQHSLHVKMLAFSKGFHQKGLMRAASWSPSSSSDGGRMAHLSRSDSKECPPPSARSPHGHHQESPVRLAAMGVA